MAKILSSIGKLTYLFTALFPLYVFWAYFFITKINFSSINFKDINLLLSGLFLLFTISSPISFYFLVKKKKSQDTELFVKNSKKESKHLISALGSISPFLIFLLEIFKDSTLYIPALITATLFFILTGIILTFKDEYGILYNLFFIRYNILSVEDKIIISNKGSCSGHVKVNQLNKRIFKKWN